MFYVQGFYILPSFHGAHQIAEFKFGSAAHQCGKMEEGDEIVQVIESRIKNIVKRIF